MADRTWPTSAVGTARGRSGEAGQVWTNLYRGDLTRAVREALLVLARTPDPDRRAEMHAALGAVRLRIGNIVEARDEFDRAIVLARPGSPGRPTYLAQAAMSRFLAGDCSGAVNEALQAQHEGGRRGDGYAVCEAYNVRALAALAEGRPYQALDLAEAGLDARSEAATQGGGPMCHLYAGLALAELDRLERAATVLEEGLALSRAEGGTGQAAWYLGTMALVAFADGRWSDAEEYAEAAVQDADEHTVLIARRTPNAIRALVASARGDVTRAREHLAGTPVEQLGGSPPGDLGVVALASVAEDARSAHEHLLDGWLHARSAPYFVAWRVLSPLLCASAVRQGDVELAHEVLASAEEGARRAPGVASARATALRCRAIVTRDADAARDAIAEYRRSPRVASQAHAWIDLAGVIAEDGAWGEAMELLQEAGRCFHELRATTWNARVGRELARIATRTAPAPAPATPDGWERLTRVEREVAVLVAQGLTNPEIAAQLMVSPRTVQTHTSHIYAKLGITSRVQLAGLVLPG